MAVQRAQEGGRRREARCENRDTAMQGVEWVNGARRAKKRGVVERHLIRFVGAWREAGARGQAARGQGTGGRRGTAGVNRPETVCGQRVRGCRQRCVGGGGRPGMYHLLNLKVLALLACSRAAA